MTSDSILQADLLDIIFENRNKSYGAYALRKHYKERVYKAMGLTFLIVAGFYALTFIPSTHVAIIDVSDPITLGHVPLVPDKPLEPKAPEKSKVAPPHPMVNSQLRTNSITFVKEGEKATVLPMNLDSVAISNQTTTGGVPGTAAKVKGTEATASGGQGAALTSVIDKETPLATADIMPSYPGGMDALRKFLQKNLHNPQDLDDGQTVSVKIRFVVGYDGVLKSFQTVEDGGDIFNNEVVRVLKKMPGWIPGKARGENVSVYYTIPVKFVAE